MAVKDHSLDDRIIKAATEEFLADGFQKASLHRIAEKAGITTGALYTRYKNKDALFLSLVQDVLTEVREAAGPMEQVYYEIRDSRDLSRMPDAMRREGKIYLDLLYRHYEGCVLLFCRNGGSSLEKQMNDMMEQKARGTAAFMKSVARKDFNEDAVVLIMQEMFHFYRMMLEKGFDREKAMACMDEILEFQEAGWNRLFEKIT